MADLSPVETLRAAAAKLRATVDNTSAGPWHVVTDPADNGFPLTAVGVQSVDEGFVFEDCATMRVDAEWIALVHPGIAEPLADWLDDTAADFETDGINEPVSSSEEYALKFARVLLGVPDA